MNGTVVRASNAEIESKNIIKNFEIVGDHIRIYYLDDSISTIINTPENIKELEAIMVEQAVEIVKGITLEYYKNKNTNLRNIRLAIYSMVLVADGALTIYLKEDDLLTFFIVSSLAAYFGLIADFIVSKNVDKEKDVIEKYKYFMSNYEDFMKYADSDVLYEGINTDKKLCIYTLDSFTHEEFDTMFRNLQRIRLRETRNN